ncbi:transketolase [Lacipirellula parvula]|uniref:Transketolase n=1 Tax=Lacipirellula parvula TaxID=2650471 RepID=A0A5K7XF24_9BACT|nr:transketolase [Lacipirellula parvula]BBO33481.1 transketolase [Lacipirellula parvula]
MATTSSNVTELTINTIRTLAMDGVEKANSGHPGTPMALAPVAYELWTNTLNYDPSSPLWPNRDRYILSCGHASMLIYSLLHLAGVKKVDANGKVESGLSVTLDDLKNFRQWHSATPGHPEYGHTTGVETTTGPLGQGVANSVGFAIAERWLAARYNRPGFKLFDYNVYAQCSDGDLMEGISQEAASIAGHLKLSNLCWIYDDNNITIEGRTNLAFSEHVPERFRALGWHVVEIEDANDLNALADAYQSFLDNVESPTLIVVHSIIGYGAPKKANTSAAHGEPLGADEIRATKAVYGWPEDQSFFVPPEAPKYFASTLGARGKKAREAWETLFAKYKQAFAKEATEIEQMQRHELPAGWDAPVPEFPADPKGVATRVSGGKALNMYAERIPWLIGGSADLAPSTKTLLTFKETGAFSADDYSGRNFHFGIREHGMAAAVNGMTISGLRAYGATFFVFSDYLRPSMRLAALMAIPSLFVFTHDSIGVGEDGPTHQPVEHLAAARAIPGLIVLRPGDANEAIYAYRAALKETKHPVAMVLTRQNLPTLDRTKYAPANGVERGGYTLIDAPGGKPQVILLATGSELSLACEAFDQLAKEGIAARVVSMPSFELFERQDAAYREQVLPAAVTARVAVEAGIRQPWDRYLGLGGGFVGMHGFGASAPAQTLYEKFGITTAGVVAEAKRVLGK